MRFALVLFLWPMLYLTASARSGASFDALATSARLERYSNDHNKAAFTKLMLWTIAHHPESQLYTRQNSENRLLLRKAWERVLAGPHNSPEALYNAGLFFTNEDPSRAVSLFTRTRRLAQTGHSKDRYLHHLAWAYAQLIANGKLTRPSEAIQKSCPPQ